MSSLTSASLISSAWASVLTAMNSTPFEPGVDHAVDGVDAAAADADDLDDGEVVLGCAGHGDYLRSQASLARVGDTAGRSAPMWPTLDLRGRDLCQPQDWSRLMQST